MGLKLDSVAQACQQIAREIRDEYGLLTLHFVPFHEGQIEEALNISTQQLVHHPAIGKALYLLKNADLPSHSGYFATIAKKQRILFGLSHQESLLSLGFINADRFDNIKDVRAMAYHCAWHGIDTMKSRRYMPRRERDLHDITMPPKNLMEAGMKNLQADTFGAIMCALDGDKTASSRIATMRALAALEKQARFKPETYPFPLAMETTQYAVNEYLKRMPPRRKRIPLSLKIAREMAMTMDTDCVRHWLAFAEAAQDMAWQQSTDEQILGSAIYISQNTYVRATGHLVAALTGIKPVSILETKGRHSAYAEHEANEILHEKAIDRIFEDVIARGIHESSSDPFIKEANRQNEALTDGHILGWCAAALQAAAKAFDKAIDKGRTQAEAAARKKFTDKRDETTWEQLKQLGREIIKQYRLGKEMTFETLQNVCENTPQYAPVLSSVTLTVRDPEYLAQLEAANDLNHIPQQPTPAPQTPAPAIAPQAAPSAPGLGGSGGHRRQSPPPQEQQQQQTQKARDGDAQEKKETKNKNGEDDHAGA